MAGDLAAIVGAGMSDETKEFLNTFYQQATQKVNAFLLKAQEYNIVTRFTLSNDNMNTVFSRMKDAQINGQNLNVDIYNDLLTYRQINTQKDQLKKINTIVGEGYALLTELGESFRQSTPISYHIYNYDGSTLKEKVFNLNDFIKTFSLDTTGKISFLKSQIGTITDDIQDQDIQSLFQKGLRKQDLFRKQHASNWKKEYYKNPNSISQWFRDRINNHKITVEEAAIISAKGAHTRGRLIEWVIAARKRSSQQLRQKDYNTVLKDMKAFYKGEDFEFNGQLIQAKMLNAGQKLQTITNGLKDLINALSKVYNELPSEINNATIKDIGNIDEQVYKTLEKDLLAIFT